MSDAKVFLQLGAWLCVLVGAFYSVLTTQLIFPPRAVSGWQALFLIIYTLLAFLPFIVFVFPGVETRRKPVLLSAAVTEILVLGLFLWNILTV